MTYTEAQIRKVMETHYPVGEFNVDLRCACPAKQVPRQRCFYCDAKVDQDDVGATQHRASCRTRAQEYPQIGTRVHGGYFPDMGTTYTAHAQFDADHLIEELNNL